MKKFWCALVLAALLGSAAVVRADDVAQIDALYAGWRDAVGSSDIPAYLQALDPDVRLLPPGADPIVGAAGYGEFLVPVFATADYQLEVAQAPQITVLGDYAIAEYTYVVHLELNNPEQGVTEPGALTESRTVTRYFDVLRKREDGKWGVWRHTWSVMPE